MTLAERIKEAMGDMTAADLARAAKVTGGAVTQWLDGTTKSLKAEKAALLEAATGYRASWIVTGRGPKRLADHAEPAPPGSSLEAVTEEERRFLGNFRDLLDEEDKAEIQRAVAEKAAKSRAIRERIEAAALARNAETMAKRGTSPGRKRAA